MVPHIDKFRFFATSSTTTTRRGGMSDFTGWGLSAEVRKYYQKFGGHFLVHDDENTSFSKQNQQSQVDVVLRSPWAIKRKSLINKSMGIFWFQTSTNSGPPPDAGEMLEKCGGGRPPKTLKTYTPDPPDVHQTPSTKYPQKCGTW